MSRHGWTAAPILSVVTRKARRAGCRPAFTVCSDYKYLRARHPPSGYASIHLLRPTTFRGKTMRPDRKSVVEGKSVSVRVDVGGRRHIQQKNNITTIRMT